MESCRSSILRQKRELRRKAGIEGGQVHHVGKTFTELVDEFIALHHINIKTIATRRVFHGWQFVDQRYERLFAEFHAKNAHMVILTPEQHKKLHMEEMLHAKN